MRGGRLGEQTPYIIIIRKKEGEKENNLERYKIHK